MGSHHAARSMVPSISSDKMQVDATVPRIVEASVLQSLGEYSRCPQGVFHPFLGGRSIGRYEKFGSCREDFLGSDELAIYLGYYGL
jgi:hypothetical protein